MGESTRLCVQHKEGTQSCHRGEKREATMAGEEEVRKVPGH